MEELVFNFDESEAPKKKEVITYTGKVSRMWKEIYHYLNKCRTKAKAERLKDNPHEDILIEYK